MTVDDLVHGGLRAQGGGQGRLLAGQRQDCQESGGGKQPCVAEGIAVVYKDVVRVPVARGERVLGLVALNTALPLPSYIARSHGPWEGLVDVAY